jgi:hypothetical protein
MHWRFVLTRNAQKLLALLLLTIQIVCWTRTRSYQCVHSLQHHSRLLHIPVAGFHQAPCGSSCCILQRHQLIRAPALHNETL